MIETTPYKAAAPAPTDWVMEGRSHPAIHFGRNTSVALMGKFIGQD